MMVFNVEFGFTALPHLPDISGARRTDNSRASKSRNLLNLLALPRTLPPFT
jgi:hypothetical protein